MNNQISLEEKLNQRIQKESMLNKEIQKIQQYFKNLNQKKDTVIERLTKQLKEAKDKNQLMISPHVVETVDDVLSMKNTQQVLVDKFLEINSENQKLNKKIASLEQVIKELNHPQSRVLTDYSHSKSPNNNLRSPLVNNSIVSWNAYKQEESASLTPQKLASVQLQQQNTKSLRRGNNNYNSTSKDSTTFSYSGNQELTPTLDVQSSSTQVQTFSTPSKPSENVSSSFVSQYIDPTFKSPLEDMFQEIQRSKKESDKLIYNQTLKNSALEQLSYSPFKKQYPLSIQSTSSPSYLTRLSQNTQNIILQEDISHPNVPKIVHPQNQRNQTQNSTSHLQNTSNAQSQLDNQKYFSSLSSLAQVQQHIARTNELTQPSPKTQTNHRQTPSRRNDEVTYKTNNTSSTTPPKGENIKLRI